MQLPIAPLSRIFSIFTTDAFGIPTEPEPWGINAVAKALSPLLSGNAIIHLPCSESWHALQVRASSPHVQPNFGMVVEVATEEDVQATVQTANRFNVPFLAVTGTHGWTTTLNNLPYGIQIRMRKLNVTTIDDGGQTATVGGGTLQHEITTALFAQKKQAVTGLCQCVSVAGPLLAGGHSALQARHGYAVDNIVSARIVLADGSVVTVSETENADLFWAIRGAGHNFGIVTRMTLRIYDIKKTWTVYTLIFTIDKIESLFKLVNKFDADPKRPSSMFLFGVGVRILDVDKSKPVIAYNVVFEGSEDEAYEWVQPFIVVGPASTQIAKNVDYEFLHTIIGEDLNSPACRTGMNIIGGTASIPKWNVTSLTIAFDIFSDMIADPRYSTSIFLLENYGIQGVQAVDPDSMSLSLEERKYPVLASPAIWWEGNRSEDAKNAIEYGDRMRQALFDGDNENTRRHTYVNYAKGDEPVEQMYGYEDWKIRKLVHLKKVYDPENRFRFYNPLV